MTDGNQLLQVALWYAERGWPVHPLKPGSKKPTLKDWPNQATTDSEQIRAWWAKTPDANIGLASGERSGLIVIDVI